MEGMKKEETVEGMKKGETTAGGVMNKCKEKKNSGVHETEMWKETDVQCAAVVCRTQLDDTYVVRVQKYKLNM